MYAGHLQRVHLLGSSSRWRHVEDMLNHGCEGDDSLQWSRGSRKGGARGLSSKGYADGVAELSKLVGRRPWFRAAAQSALTHAICASPTTQTPLGLTIPNPLILCYMSLLHVPHVFLCALPQYT